MTIDCLFVVILYNRGAQFFWAKGRSVLFLMHSRAERQNYWLNFRESRVKKPIVLYLYICIALLALHANQKRFQYERPREKRAVCYWLMSMVLLFMIVYIVHLQLSVTICLHPLRQHLGLHIVFFLYDDNS